LTIIGTAGSISDELTLKLTLTIIGMLKSSPKEYANKILTKIRKLSRLVHNLRNENKAFIDSLDIDAQLIRKGKRIASLEALSKKIGWQDNAFQTCAQLTERGQSLYRFS
jgi:hypothetical protein